MAPQYIFCINEFTEHPDAVEQHEGQNWKPVAQPLWNIPLAGGASGRWWHCDGNNIRLLPADWQPPAGSRPYKVFSTMYGDGHGFWILRGDATAPTGSEDFRQLWFNWDEQDLSSSISNVGQQRTLRVQNSSTGWPRMLLPDIYHGPQYDAPNYGGLTGDLPVFLGLLALSMKPERLLTELPRLMKNGGWGEHHRHHGRTHKRGVIVKVYAYNNNDLELEDLEEGRLGKYYN
ncbi:hypothetical protein BKA63DRAFT_72403 [Paraphoma chrysanthemicola]|nr:hypothetical protein BKA63DRAFT_72403 [Paraphoma chrysanthemicola]